MWLFQKVYQKHGKGEGVITYKEENGNHPAETGGVAPLTCFKISLDIFLIVFFHVADEALLEAMSEGIDGKDAALEDVVPGHEEIVRDDEYELMAAEALLDLATYEE